MKVGGGYILLASGAHYIPMYMAGTSWYSE